jgi:hypothetical protein
VRGTAFIAGWGIPPSLRGTVNMQLMHAADWLSTLVVGVARGNTTGTLPLDGVNQWPALVGGDATTRKEVVYGHQAGPTNGGLRQGRWKLLRGGGDKPSGWTAPGYGLQAPPNTQPISANGSNSMMHAMTCYYNLTNGTCCSGNDAEKLNVSLADCCAQCEARADCVGFNWRTDAHDRCYIKNRFAHGKCTRAPACVTSAAASSPPSPPAPMPGVVSLYDVGGDDPGERVDVSSQHPEVVSTMLARLREIDATVRASVEPGPGDLSCPVRHAQTDPVVGFVWKPWC